MALAIETGAARRHDHPVWDGSPLAGRHDPAARRAGLRRHDPVHPLCSPGQARGGAVVVECWPQLLPLLRGCAGIDHLIAQGSPLPPCDVRAPLLSLPRIFGTTLTTIPETVPYLTPDPEAVQHWREELSNCRGFKVGIAWQGSPTQPRDASRSLRSAISPPWPGYRESGFTAFRKGRAPSSSAK